MEVLTQFFSQKSVIFDLALVAVILLFAILGARKGLILSLCSLVAVILGLVGGTMVADALTPPLAAQAAPMAQGFLSEYLEELTLYGAQALEQAEGFLPHVVKGVLEQKEWLLQADGFLEEFTLAVTEAILHPILFLIAFILILIVWYFISHTLDLVARLPVLSALNAAGGFLIGAVKGVLFLILVYLLLETFRPDLIPADLLAHSKILSYIQKTPSFL